MASSSAAAADRPRSRSASPALPWEVVVPASAAVRLLLTKVRDRDTGNAEFKAYADRLMTLLAEEVRE